MNKTVLIEIVQTDGRGAEDTHFRAGCVAILRDGAACSRAFPVPPSLLFESPYFLLINLVY